MIRNMVPARRRVMVPFVALAMVGGLSACQPKQRYWRDADGDGYGNPSRSKLATSRPRGFVRNKRDCNDSNKRVNPSRTEIPGNGLNDDCNRSTPGPANAGSVNAAIADGAGRVAFESGASNLVPGDTNGSADIFLRNIPDRINRRISVTSTGGQANGASYDPQVSSNASKVVFVSQATNLVPGDTNLQPDVFVRDRAARTTVRVSIATDGTQASTGASQPAISPDGRWVAFSSDAGNLVPDDTNGKRDVFVHDLVNHTTERVSAAPGRVQVDGASGSPSISRDGIYVVFTSTATDIAPGDTSGRSHVYLKNVFTGSVRRVSSLAGTPGNENSFGSSPNELSNDAASAAFTSFASNLVAGDNNGGLNAFVKYPATGDIVLASRSSSGVLANAPVGAVALSGDGATVAFQTTATNLDAGDTNGALDVFRRDLGTGTTRRISVAASGVPANGPSFSPSVSGDGATVAFHSKASNLVGGDTNGSSDVFVTNPLRKVSVTT